MANVSGGSTPLTGTYNYRPGDFVAAYTMSGGTTEYIIRNGKEERTVKEMPNSELAALKRAAASEPTSSRYQPSSRYCSSCNQENCDGHNG